MDGCGQQLAGRLATKDAHCTVTRPPSAYTAVSNAWSWQLQAAPVLHRPDSACASCFDHPLLPLCSLPDMFFDIPVHKYQGHDLVVHGWHSRVYGDKDW